MHKKEAIVWIFGLLAISASLSACLKEVQLPLFRLTVEKGSGSGNYPAGASVRVVADPPGSQRFLGWEGDTVHLDRTDNPEAHCTMPDSNIVLMAYCLPKDEPSFRYEVFPIIQQYCAIDQCHKNSIKQPDFDSYEAVVASATKMELYLEIGFMPLGSSLPPNKKQLLLNWLRQGHKNN